MIGLPVPANLMRRLQSVLNSAARLINGFRRLHMPYLSASEVMIHEQALYQVYVPLPL